MKADVDGDLVSIAVTEKEYHIIMGGLRELVAEMHEKDFPPRMGVSREQVSELAQSFFDESIRLGIEE